MLVLIAAVTMGLVVALIFFCLNYSRLLGSNAEQKKAIELEIADVQIYLLRLADVLDIDIAAVVREKIQINEGRF